MAETVGSIQYVLDLDDSKFKGKADQASSDVKGLAGNFQKAEQASQIFAAGIIAAGVAVAAFGVSSVKAFTESQDVAAQLNAVLKSTHGASGLVAQDILDQALALQKLTKFGDEAIVSSANLLLTFTSIKGPIMKEAIATTLDMSQALGQDLKSSAIQLGKALNDPIQGVTALRRVGVSFSEAQLKVIKTMQESGNIMGAQKLILKELSTEFGGSAAAAGKTFSGQMAILNNEFNDFQELVGGAIVNALTPFITQVNALITSMGGAQGVFDYLTKTIFPQIISNLPIIIGLIVGGLIPALIAAAGAVIPLIVALAPFVIIGGLIGLIVKLIIDNWTTLVALWGTTVAFVGTLWTAIVDAFTAGWNAIVTFFTVGVPTFINNFIVWLQELPKNILLFIWNVIILGTIEFFGMLTGIAIYGTPVLIKTIIDFLKALPGMIWNILVAVYNFFSTAFTNIKDWLMTNIPIMIAAVVAFFMQLPGQIWNAMVQVKEKAVSGMQSAWQGIVAEVSQWIPRLKEWGSNLMQAFADGIKAKIQAIADAFKAGMDKAKKLVEGHSPPVEGPFKDIDKWGFNVGSAWVGGFKEAFASLQLPSMSMPNMGGSSTSTSNNNININIAKVGNDQDVQSLGREMGFRLNLMPQ